MGTTLADGGIYSVINAVNGKVYVGSALNIPVRIKRHRADLRYGRHSNPHLQNAYNAYGSEAFEYHVVEAVADRSCLVEREQHWIDALGAASEATGYNIITYVAHRAEFPRPRTALSAALKGIPKSAGHRARISAALTGRPGVPLTPEKRAVLAEVWRGRRHAPETLTKMSAAQKARTFGPLTPEHRANLSAARKGVPKSARPRASMSSAAGKLRDEQVLELRARAAAGEKVPPIAAEFGISRGAAYAIVRGDTYKHLIHRPDAVYCITPGLSPPPVARTAIPARFGDVDDDDTWSNDDE